MLTALSEQLPLMKGVGIVNSPNRLRFTLEVGIFEPDVYLVGGGDSTAGLWYAVRLRGETVYVAGGALTG